MRNWSTDKIISTGLIIALLIKIVGDIVITVINGTPPPSDFSMNIVTGLAGYMGRSLLEKSKILDERKDKDANQ